MPVTQSVSMELTIAGTQPDDEGRPSYIGVADDADYVLVAIDLAGRVLAIIPSVLNEYGCAEESIIDAYQSREAAELAVIKVEVAVRGPGATEKIFIVDRDIVAPSLHPALLNFAPPDVLLLGLNNEGRLLACQTTFASLRQAVRWIRGEFLH